MIVNFAIQSLVWAAFVLIAVAIEDAVLEPGGTTPSMSTKATQTHSVTVGKVRSFEFDIFSDVKY